MRDDGLEVRLHRIRLALELLAMRVGEARPMLGLELVTRQVLGPELESVGEVGIEIGGGLARNPVDEVERDVVKSGITKMVEGTPDGVRLDNTVEDLQQVRPEALHAQRDSIHTLRAQHAGELLRHGLGIRLDRHLACRRQRGQQALERGWLRKRRRAPAEKDRLQLRREPAALELELGEQPLDVIGVLGAPPDRRHEVAVAAPVRAEGKVHVEMPGAEDHDFFSVSRLSTARNASCGTSTIPTCFMRFFPAFCFSSSFRLREMSPP